MIIAVAVSVVVSVCIIIVFALWYITKSRDISQNQWKEIVNSVHTFRTQVRSADENMVEFVNTTPVQNFASTNPYAGMEDLKIPSLLKLANIEDPMDPAAAAQFTMSDTYKELKRAASKKLQESSASGSSSNNNPFSVTNTNHRDDDDDDDSDDDSASDSIENPLRYSMMQSPSVNMRSSTSLSAAVGNNNTYSSATEEETL
jgi:hypothetical protein